MEARRLKALEEENRKLKKLLAGLKELLTKKMVGPAAKREYSEIVTPDYTTKYDAAQK